MIREANIDDVDRIVELGMGFYNQSVWRERTDWNSDNVKMLVEGMIESPDFIIYVSVIDGVIVGMIGAAISTIWYCGDSMIQELFWYVDPEYRNGEGHKLLKTLENKAKDDNIKFILMIGLSETPLIDKYYERNGYVPSENMFLKEL